jgi:transposase
MAFEKVPLAKRISLPFDEAEGGQVMLSKEDLIVIQHYLKEGLPKTAIAERLGIDRKTVQRHAASWKDARYGPRPPKPSILDAYKDYIRGRLELYPELTAIRLLCEITVLGYQGKYTIVKRFIRQVRPQAPLEIEQRFEVPPGQQAQVDFATFKTSFGTVYALLVVLSWSRYLWVRFFYHQDQLTVLGGLHRAFITFGGVPQTVLFDRMKTAVARTADDGRAIFNEEMLRFAAHYGFRPLACQPYRAKTKGKVERAVSYLRKSFFYGRYFRDLEDLNRQLEDWLNGTANSRVHATTGEVPTLRMQTEKNHLLALPSSDYIPMITLGRKISRDGYVAYNGNDYSVPEGLFQPEVTVAATLAEVRLYQDGRLVATHPLLESKGQRRLNPDHRHYIHRSPHCQWQSEADGVGLMEVQRRSLEIY